ncbi:MAG TPA: phosphatidate cytidylyltransferase [Wenzhouxiangella sp.]|nr:phosphatidate cytidylyltransferase [Wenzhouxiangella sp.]
MLEQRFLTAVVLAAAGLLAVFFLPPLWFAAAAAGLLLVAGGWEAARLAGLTNPALRWLFGLVLAAAGASMHLSNMPPVPFLAAACLLWLLGFAWLGRANTQKPARPAATAVLKLVATGWLLLAAWLGLCLVQAHSPWLVVLMLVIIAAADTCAYFAGRRFGGPKLAPAISPGKTRSGAAGGLIGAALFATLAAAVLPARLPAWPVVTAVALVLAAISIGGDLFFSLLKRQGGLKDSSALLPGHGGILDRFDSLAAVSPFFALFVCYLGAS